MELLMVTTASYSGLLMWKIRNVTGPDHYSGEAHWNESVFGCILNKVFGLMLHCPMLIACCLCKYMKDNNIGRIQSYTKLHNVNALNALPPFLLFAHPCLLFWLIYSLCSTVH